MVGMLALLIKLESMFDLCAPLYMCSCNMNYWLVADISLVLP